jgi:hypothetical protein
MAHEIITNLLLTHKLKVARELEKPSDPPGKTKKLESAEQLRQKAFERATFLLNLFGNKQYIGRMAIWRTYSIELPAVLLDSSQSTLSLWGNISRTDKTPCPNDRYDFISCLVKDETNEETWELFQLTPQGMTWQENSAHTFDNVNNIRHVINTMEQKLRHIYKLDQFT